MLLLLILPLVMLLIWITGFLFASDFSVPVRNARQFQRVLVIFPHADDEAITCSGSLHQIAGSSTVTLVLLTRGERGTSDATVSNSLKDIRAEEARAVTAILGTSRLIQEDFGDGALHLKKSELTTFIAATIEREKPELLITYDLAGFYGHKDHITCSEIITELQKNRFPGISLWYVTFPKRVLALARLPEHMATQPGWKKQRALPTHKLFIGVSIFAKIRACYTYKSQRETFTQGVRKLLPLWFFLSMMLFEYYAEVGPDREEK